MLYNNLIKNNIFQLNFYQNHRDIESLKNYIFSQITTPIHFISSIEDVHKISQLNTLPFFVEYCGSELDYCLTEVER